MGCVTRVTHVMLENPYEPYLDVVLPQSWVNSVVAWVELAELQTQLNSVGKSQLRELTVVNTFGSSLPYLVWSQIEPNNSMLIATTGRVMRFYDELSMSQ